MNRAILYLQVTSLVNNLRQRLLRLRQPKYLAGLVVGLLYFYFFLGRGFHHGGGPAVSVNGTTPGFLGPLLLQAYALILASIVALCWLFPGERASLRFTETEIAVLFPAPISRNTLIHYRILKAQLPILFSSLLFTLLMRNLHEGRVWLHLLAWWLGFSCLQLHRMAAAFTLERLAAQGLPIWLRRSLVGLLLGALARLVLYQFFNDTISSPEDFVAALSAPPLSWLTWPFRLVVAPLFANSPLDFLKALPPLLILIGLHYLWVLLAQVPFEEASIDAEQKRSTRLSNIARGARPEAPKNPRPIPFPLPPSGWPSLAFLWKGLITAGRFFHPRIAGSFILLLWIAASSLTRFPAFAGLKTIIGSLSLMLCLWVLAFGAMLIRRGVPQMKEHMDVLKATPLHGWQIVLGEMLTPIYLITLLEWALLGLAVLCNPLPALASPWLAALHGPALAGIALLIPFLIGLMCSVQFAAFLLFPAFVSSLGVRNTGIEMLGQRLIFTLGYLLIFFLTLLPAAALAAIPFSLFYLLLNAPSIALLSGCLVGGAALAGELSVVVWWLGERFERFDLSAEGQS